MRFSVLASGSRGNAAVVEHEGAAVLVDAGLRPRRLIERLGRVGLGVEQLAAVVLTHAHGDHACDDTFKLLAARRVRLYCHESHAFTLASRPGFGSLAASGLVRAYDDRPVLPVGGLWVDPIELSHSGPTYGFRFECRAGRGRSGMALGYLTDSGCWDDRTADSLADVDLLAVESNHDEELTRASGRHPRLIARNLGPRGHLSNEQAAGLVAEVVRRSGRGRVGRVVLLHLSEQCNRPELALAATRAALRDCGRRPALAAASFTEVVPPLPVGSTPRSTRA